MLQLDSSPSPVTPKAIHISQALGCAIRKLDFHLIMLGHQRPQTLIEYSAGGWGRFSDNGTAFT